MGIIRSVASSNKNQKNFNKASAKSASEILRCRFFLRNIGKESADYRLGPEIVVRISTVELTGIQAVSQLVPDSTSI